MIRRMKKIIHFMKNFLKCIIILFLTCSANYSFAGPEIRLNKIAFDFGDVSSDKILEDTLIFKNTGDEVLKLKARVSCECSNKTRNF